MDTDKEKNNHPVSGPKVIDLSPTNSPSSTTAHPHRRAFIFGLLTVVLLTIAAIVVGFFYIRQRTTTPPKAAQCFGWATYSQGPNSQSDSAFARGVAYNNCPTPIKVYIYRFWCPAVHKDGCGANPNNDFSQVLNPGEKSKSLEATQKIGNTGDCGSAQVDITLNSPWSAGGGDVTQLAGIAWGSKDCSTTPPPPQNHST